MARRFWLMKSEPDVFSFEHLKKEPKKTAHWDGVRNYQARNILRDDIQVGDGVLFYHSRIDPPAIVGTAEVVRSGYPDHTQFDPSEKYYDPKANEDNPRWYMVDIRYDCRFEEPLTLPHLREMPQLEGMMLLKKGARLSVQPVTKKQWDIILRHGGLGS